MKNPFCFSSKPDFHLPLLRAECGNHQQRGEDVPTARSIAALVSWMPGVFIAAMDHGGVCKIVPRIISRIKNQPQMLGSGLRPEPGQLPGRNQTSAEAPWDLMVLEDAGEEHVELALELWHQNAISSLAVPLSSAGCTFWGDATRTWVSGRMRRKGLSPPQWPSRG